MYRITNNCTYSDFGIIHISASSECPHLQFNLSTVYVILHVHGTNLKKLYKNRKSWFKCTVYEIAFYISIKEQNCLHGNAHWLINIAGCTINGYKNIENI